MIRLFAAALLLLPLAVTPQVQPGGGGSVEGVVVLGATGEPLAGARVTLAAVTAAAAPRVAGPVVTGSAGDIPADAVAAASRNAPPSSLAVTTGPDGRFAFVNLGSGLYNLQVLANGYARQSYGQRTPGGPATALRMGAGQAVRNIVMSLVPAGAVSGVIRGPEGQPQAGVPVQLLRAAYNASGQRTFQVEGNARTNDRGEYRLYWITPGRYYLGAGTPPGPGRPAGPAAPVSTNEIPDVSFPFSFYPGVWDARAAAWLDVGSGTELNGVDFSVARQQLYRVRGRVVDSRTGAPPAAVGLSLAYRTLAGASGAFNSGERYDPRTGEFELRNVPPGYYVVQAVAQDRGLETEGETAVRIGALAAGANARVPIEVSNKIDGNIDGIVLHLSPGVALPGRITVDGMPLSSVNGWERVRVQLKPTLDSAFGPNVQPATPVPQAPGPDGSFVTVGVSPGEFSVGPVAGLPAGLYVREARFNQTDVLNQPLRFSGTVGSPLEIVLSSRSGQLDGIAVDARSNAAGGARVVLVPEQRNRTDLYRTAASDTGGRFQFRSIPPGDYRVFSWEALESYAYFDPELLRRFEPQGVAVRISESSPSSHITVRTIPANP